MPVYTQAYSAYAVGLFLATIFFAQRVYTKLKILGSFAVEDWLLTAAFALSIGTQAIGLRLFVDRVVGSYSTEMLQWQRDELAVVGTLFLETSLRVTLTNTQCMVYKSPWSWHQLCIRQPHASPN